MNVGGGRAGLGLAAIGAALVLLLSASCSGSAPSDDVRRGGAAVEPADSGGAAAREDAAATSGSAETPPEAPSGAGGEPASLGEAPPASGAPIRRLSYAADEAIDVEPAVLFAGVDGSGVVGWQFPNSAAPEFVVAPGGNFILWEDRPAGEPRTVHLFRTDPEADVIVAAALGEGGPALASGVLTIAPDSGGFVWHTGDALEIRDEFGAVLGTVDIASKLAEPVDVDWSERDAEGRAWLAWTDSRADDGAIVLVAPVADLSQTRVAAALGEAADLPGSPGPRVGVAWGPGGRELAVTTLGRLMLIDRPSGVRWTVEDAVILGNPQWEADGTIRVITTERTTRFYGARGDLVRETPEYLCGGPPPSELGADRTVELVITGERVLVGPGEQRIVVATADPAVGFHTPHFGTELGRVHVATTSDGSRVVVSTPTVGHGGCAS